MSPTYLTMNERNKREALHKEDYSARKIADILGYHPSSIRRESKKCEDNWWRFRESIIYGLTLRRKGENRILKDNRGKFRIEKSISERPEEMKKRTEFGHLEGDLVVSF